MSFLGALGSFLIHFGLKASSSYELIQDTFKDSQPDTSSGTTLRANVGGFDDIYSRCSRRHLRLYVSKFMYLGCKLCFMCFALKFALFCHAVHHAADVVF